MIQERRDMIKKGLFQIESIRDENDEWFAHFRFKNGPWEKTIYKSHHKVLQVFVDQGIDGLRIKEDEGRL